MSNSGDIKLKIKKLKEMVRAGEPNESKIAETKISMLEKRHKLSESNAKEKRYCFKVKEWKDETAILAHCIFDTRKDAKVEGSEQLNKVCAVLTEVEYKMVKMKMEYYWGDYLEKRDKFLIKYIIKNKLGLESNIKKLN